MRVPSILAICALDAHIDGKRLSGCQRVAPCTVRSFEIVGMKLPCSKSPCSSCFFQGTAGVTSPLLVDETARSIRLVGCDHRRDRVDRQQEFALRRLELRFAPAQRLLGTLLIFDVEADAVPANYPACVITQWHATRKMPAIFAVGAAQSPLSFKRDAGSERVSPFSINAWHVVRVKDAVGVR